MRKIEIDRKDLGIGDKFNFVNASESYKYIGLYSYNQIDYFLYKDIRYKRVKSIYIIIRRCKNGRDTLLKYIKY